MTLAASPTSTQSSSLSDQDSDIDNDSLAIQPVNFEKLDYADSLVQCLGYDVNSAPAFGQVSVEHSNDVHIGDKVKNIYQGPVTIKQLLYPNGDLLPAANSEIARSNLTFDSYSVSVSEKGGDDSKQSCDSKAEEIGKTGPKSKLLKGYIWLQNTSRQRPLEISIFIGVVILSITILMLVLFLRNSDITIDSQTKNKLRMISRQEWLAQPPVNPTDPLATPVEYVLIHHTASEDCSSQAQCIFFVRNCQTFHIESKGFNDIGYNFLVGGDGAAYVGRGWTVVGAHLFGWNIKSIGIAFIGTFNTNIPPDIQMLTGQKLIDLGVKQGYIREDYKIVAARQLSGTQSPGLAFYQEIQKWPHWTSSP